jgi:hypothetical protein
VCSIFILPLLQIVENLLALQQSFALGEKFLALAFAVGLLG